MNKSKLIKTIIVSLLFVIVSMIISLIFEGHLENFKYYILGFFIFLLCYSFIQRLTK